MKSEKTVTKRTWAAVALAAAAMAVASLHAGRAIDDAAFVLDIRGDMNGSAAIDANELGNKLDFSAASPVTAAVQSHAGSDPSFQSVALAAPMYPMTTNACTVLNIPQDSKIEDGVLNVSTTRIDLKKAAVMGSDTQTCYIRFRWNGNPYTKDNVRCWIAMNRYYWNPRTGWGIGIEQVKGSTYGTVCVVIPQQTKTVPPSQTSQRIEPGKWYDLFVTITPSGENSVVQVDLLPTPTLRSDGTFESAAFKTYTLGTGYGLPRLTFVADSSNAIFLGAESVMANWTKADNSTNAIRTFAGDLANLMIWNRELTWPERWEIASGCGGALWSVGAVNGSADEFAATNPADVHFVTNDWRFMRRELTEANPTLTLKGPLPANEAGRGHYVSIATLWGDGQAPVSCPVEIAVNGTSAGIFDLTRRRGRCAFIPGGLWTSDADGNATLTITRQSPFESGLSIDALAVDGSWAFGTEDGRHNELSPESVAAHTAVAGDLVAKHVRRAVTKSNPTIRFLFYAPPDAAERADGLFETAMAGTSGSMAKTLAGHAAVDVYVNDARVGGWENIKYDAKLSLKIPASFVKEGLNTLIVSNAVSAATLSSLGLGSGDAWLNFDHFRYTCKVIPEVGFLIRMR